MEIYHPTVTALFPQRSSSRASRLPPRYGLCYRDLDQRPEYPWMQELVWKGDHAPIPVVDFRHKWIVVGCQSEALDEASKSAVGKIILGFSEDWSYFG